MTLLAWLLTAIVLTVCVLIMLSALASMRRSREAVPAHVESGEPREAIKRRIERDL